MPENYEEVHGVSGKENEMNELIEKVYARFRSI